jgi:hypothetical protein
MAARGIKTKYLETVNWRAIPQHIQDQTNRIKTALQEDGFEDAVIVLAMVDNAFFLARYVDGSEIPIRRGNEGVFHVDGDLGYAPMDKLKIIYNQVEPLLKEFGDQDKLLLTPLPRATSGPHAAMTMSTLQTSTLKGTWWTNWPASTEHSSSGVEWPSGVR